MSGKVDIKNWRYMSEVIPDFQYQDWMDMAQSVSDMLVHLCGGFLDLSLENFIYNVETKECWLLDDGEFAYDGNPIACRWYPPRFWESFDNMIYNTDVIAAFVVLEFMYGKSPFYHEDVETYKRNIRERIRTAGKPAEKDRKAAWMLMYTAFVGYGLDSGERHLLDLYREEGKNSKEVIANWKEDENGWGPVDETNCEESWTEDDVDVEYKAERDSNHPSPQGSGSKGLRPESSDGDAATDEHRQCSVGI